MPTSTPTPTAVQESRVRTPNGSQGVQPPSTVRRSSRRVYIGIGIGISCSLARKFTIAIKHLSLSLSASLLGRCPGLLVCSGQAQAYSQVLPTYSIVHRVIVTYVTRPCCAAGLCLGASHRIASLAGSLKNLFGLGLKIPARASWASQTSVRGGLALAVDALGAGSMMYATVRKRFCCVLYIISKVFVPEE